jgi:hypothetical protein
VNAQSVRRVIRTILQMLVGAAGDQLFQQLLVDIPDRYDPYAIVAWGVAVAATQNALEDTSGKIPALFKGPASGAKWPVPIIKAKDDAVGGKAV